LQTSYETILLDGSQKIVTPVKTGSQGMKLRSRIPDSGFRRNGGKDRFGLRPGGGDGEMRFRDEKKSDRERL